MNIIINQICELDKKINEYENMIEKEKIKQNDKDNIKCDENINTKERKLENLNQRQKSKETTSELESEKKIDKKKNSKSKIQEIILGNDIIDNIIKNDGKIEIIVIQPDNNIETKFTLKNVSKTFYFYHCTKRPKCSGKGKFNRNEKKFYITESCTDVDIHNKLTYDSFMELINNNKTHLIDFHLKKNQQNLINIYLKILKILKTSI